MNTNLSDLTDDELREAVSACGYREAVYVEPPVVDPVTGHATIHAEGALGAKLLPLIVEQIRRAQRSPRRVLSGTGRPAKSLRAMFVMMRTHAARANSV